MDTDLAAVGTGPLHMNNVWMLISLLLALLAGALFLNLEEDKTEADSAVQPLQRQVDALQGRVEELQRQQQELELQWATWQEDIYWLGEMDALPDEEDLLDPLEAPAEDDDVPPSLTAREREQVRQRERVEAAGLTVEEYAEMQRLAGELRMEQVEENYQRRREEYNTRELVLSSRERMRETLGDDGYDRYLYATGRANRVSVSEVLSGSAAEQTGLVSGDIILSYDGERIFSFGELRNLSYRGDPGEAVLVEVRREDGSREQLVIPRGPLGVRSGRGIREAPQ